MHDSWHWRFLPLKLTVRWKGREIHMYKLILYGLLSSSYKNVITFCTAYCVWLSVSIEWNFHTSVRWGKQTFAIVQLKDCSVSSSDNTLAALNSLQLIHSLKRFTSGIPEYLSSLIDYHLPLTFLFMSSSIVDICQGLLSNELIQLSAAHNLP